MKSFALTQDSPIFCNHPQNYGRLNLSVQKSIILDPTVFKNAAGP